MAEPNTPRDLVYDKYEQPSAHRDPLYEDRENLENVTGLGLATHSDIRPWGEGGSPLSMHDLLVSVRMLVCMCVMHDDVLMYSYVCRYVCVYV